MKTLIIEDELQAISALKAELATHCPQVDVIDAARTVSDAIKKIKLHNPDLIFLDIQLADGLGFDIIENFKDHNFKIIFTTAYSQYAIKAIRFSALDYLLKPIDALELIHAVEKAESINKSSEWMKIQTLISNFTQAPQKKKIALQTSEGINIYELDNIISCSADRNYTELHLTNGKKVLYSKTLKEFEDLLINSGFERIHHSHIINLNHMVSFINKDGGYAKMSDNSEIPVSQRKRAQLIDALNKINR